MTPVPQLPAPKAVLSLLVPLFLALAFPATASAQEAAAPAQDSPAPWRIGQAGPGGGIVFFDKGDSLGGWRWLEAAPADLPAPVPWGGLKVNVEGTSPHLGAGPANTRLIAAALSGLPSAAALCLGFSHEGVSDWFLPSLDELTLAWRFLHQRGLGHFDGGAGYWTSTQHDPGQSWEIFFANGRLYPNGLKSHPLKVRPIRRF